LRPVATYPKLILFAVMGFLQTENLLGYDYYNFFWSEIEFSSLFEEKTGELIDHFRL